MKKLLRIQFFFLILPTILMLSGCFYNTPLIHSYYLSSQHSDDVNLKQSIEKSILLIPVRLPTHLNQSGIVTRSIPGKHNISSSHIWSGTLQDQVTQAVAANLSSLLQTDTISIYPGPHYLEPDYSIEIFISEFSPDPKSFVLNANWNINNRKTKKFIKNGSTTFSVPVETTDYAHYVEKGSTLLLQLSQDIATAIREINISPEQKQ